MTLSECADRLRRDFTAYIKTTRRHNLKQRQNADLGVVLDLVGVGVGIWAMRMSGVYRPMPDIYPPGTQVSWAMALRKEVVPLLRTELRYASTR